MQNELENEVRYRLLKMVEEHPDWSQRQLAVAMGISLGKLNFWIKALMDHGLVKAGRFARSTNKTGYRYLLTVSGIVEKSRVTARFLSAKEHEFDVIRREIAELKLELDEASVGN